MRKNNYTLLFLLLVQLCTIYLTVNSNQTASLHEQYQFKYITTNDGMSDNNVASICQDYRGFMWFGTWYRGINRYDGFNVQSYLPNPEDSTSLMGSRVYVIFSDSKNNLWIGTDKGLNLYNRKQDNFIHFIHPEMPDGFISVTAIEEDKNGILWIGTDGLYAFNLNDNSLKSYLNKEGYPTQSINHLYIDKSGTLWCAENENGVYAINTETLDIKHFIVSEKIYKQKGALKVYRIFQDSQNKLWFGTYDNGLFLYNPNNSTFKELYPDKNNKFSYRVKTIIEDDFGNVFLGTRAGLYIKNKKENTFKHYAHTKHDFSILSHNSINLSYKDNTGGLWFVTSAGGVNYTNMYKRPFIHYSFKKEDNHFLNDKNVYAITQDKNNNIYIGTEQGGLNILNRNTDLFTYYCPDENNPYSINHYDIKAFAWDKKGNLWIGTDRGGLNYLDTKTMKFYHITNEPGNTKSLISNRKPYPFIDSRNNLWVLYPDQPYLELKKDGTNEFLHLSQETSLGFAEDSWGNIWFGTETGLAKYNYETNSFTEYSNDSIVKNVETILIDSKGQIWIGNNNGLAMFNLNTNKFKGYNAKNKFPFETVYGILEDNNKNLWVSTLGNGLIKFINVVENPHSKEIKIFTSHDGVQGKQFSKGSFFKSPTGEMFFGGINGFNSFYPEQITDNPFIPKVAITQLNIFNQPVNIGDTIKGKIILKNSITETKFLKLSYKHNIFSLEFKALHYAQPEQNKYAYKLENFDDDWNYASGYHYYATYTSLPAGEYIFKVKAANSDNLWGDPVELAITILPPWYKTWFFRISLTFIIIGLAVSFYLIRINQIKRQKEELEKEVIKRTKELQEANEELKSQKEEIQTQNEEIQQQTEELLTKNEQISKAYENMRILSEFGQNITSTLKLDAINAMIYNYVGSLMDTSAFGIGVYYPTGNYIEYLGFMENGKKIPPFINRMEDKNSLSVWCLKNKKEIFINNYDEEIEKYTKNYNNLKTKNKPQSNIYVPLIVENNAIGVVTVQSYNKNAYSDNDLDNLLSFASYIAIALDNANVYEIVNKQNNKIKSSIEYAKTIQQSILPVESNIKKYLNCFILFQPRDIVSGDFYWFTTAKEKEKEYVFLAVVDCTGHGVPGAFMSLIGNRILNEIVNQKKVYNPAQILEFLNVGIQLALKQDQTDNNDGMDVCLCRIEKHKNNGAEVIFSGAKRPLFIMRQNFNEIERISGDRKSIGGIRAKRSKLFYTNTNININEGDILYLTSDGFVDQNAENRKKYGSKNLESVLTGLKDEPLAKQKEILEKEMIAHMNKQEQRDDITIVGIKL